MHCMLQYAYNRDPIKSRLRTFSDQIIQTDKTEKNIKNCYSVARYSETLSNIVY